MWMPSHYRQIDRRLLGSSRFQLRSVAVTNQRTLPVSNQPGPHVPVVKCHERHAGHPTWRTISLPGSGRGSCGTSGLAGGGEQSPSKPPLSARYFKRGPSVFGHRVLAAQAQARRWFVARGYRVTGQPRPTNSLIRPPKATDLPTPARA